MRLGRRVDVDDVDKLENYIPSCEVADIIGRDVRTVQKLTKDVA